MSNPTLPPAWYPDPVTPGQLRWWDGLRWTEQVSQPQYPLTNAGPTGTRYAGFWERFCALLIDSLIVYVPIGIAAAVFADGIAGVVLWFAIALVADVAYFIGLIGRDGQTIGMRALSIRVVVEGGGLPGYPVATKRWLLPGGLGLLDFVPGLNVVAALVVLLDFLSMLWDGQKQCWHDKIAKTWVVHERDRPEQVTSYP